MRVCKDDKVLVLTGISKGKRSRVVSVHRDKNKVTVEGVGVVHKHVRRSRRNLQGGILSREMPVAVSNVQVICPHCDHPTRVGVVFKDKVKYRVCKKCNKTISPIGPAK